MMITGEPMPAGDVVSARPWRGGRELAEQRAVIMSAVWDTAGVYLLLYFPGLGDPAVGTSVMPIRRDRITNVVPAVMTPVKFASRAYAAMRRARRFGTWRDEWNPGGMAFERAHRARLRERREGAA